MTTPRVTGERSQRVWIIDVPGDPVPWARPRKRRGPGYYEQPAVTTWRLMIATYALAVKPSEPTRAALDVRTRFRLRRPASVPSSVKFPTKKPDLDNFHKCIGDCLNHIIFHDDAQIISAVSEKVYAGAGEAPGVLIQITEILP